MRLKNKGYHIWFCSDRGHTGSHASLIIGRSDHKQFICFVPGKMYRVFYRGDRAGPDLGIYGDPVTGARPVFRARRLCNGNVPQAAGDRRENHFIYADRRNDRTAGDLETVFICPSCNDPCCGSSGHSGRSDRILYFPKQDQRGLFFDHISGADLGGVFSFYRPAVVHRRECRYHRDHLTSRQHQGRF